MTHVKLCGLIGNVSAMFAQGATTFGMACDADM